MKKIYCFILIVTMISVCTYSQDRKNLLPNQQVINELKMRNENFRLVKLFHAPEQRIIRGIKGEEKTYFHYTIDKKELRNFFIAKYQSIKFALPMPNGSFENLL